MIPFAKSDTTDVHSKSGTVPRFVIREFFLGLIDPDLSRPEISLPNFDTGSEPALRVTMSAAVLMLIDLSFDLIEFGLLVVGELPVFAKCEAVKLSASLDEVLM